MRLEVLSYLAIISEKANHGKKTAEERIEYERITKRTTQTEMGLTAMEYATIRRQQMDHVMQLLQNHSYSQVAEMTGITQQHWCGRK